LIGSGDPGYANTGPAPSLTIEPPW